MTELSPKPCKDLAVRDKTIVPAQLWDKMSRLSRNLCASYLQRFPVHSLPSSASWGFQALHSSSLQDSISYWKINLARLGSIMTENKFQTALELLVAALAHFLIRSQTTMLLKVTSSCYNPNLPTVLSRTPNDFQPNPTAIFFRHRRFLPECLTLSNRLPEDLVPKTRLPVDYLPTASKSPPDYISPFLLLNDPFWPSKDILPARDDSLSTATRLIRKPLADRK